MYNKIISILKFYVKSIYEYKKFNGMRWVVIQAIMLKVCLYIPYYLQSRRCCVYVYIETCLYRGNLIYQFQIENTCALPLTTEPYSNLKFSLKSQNKFLVYIVILCISFLYNMEIIKKLTYICKIIILQLHWKWKKLKSIYFNNIHRYNLILHWTSYAERCLNLK